MKSCFMFGHSDCPESMLPRIEQAIEKYYAEGVTEFYIGSRGRFDSLAATAVKRAKGYHKDIRLYVVLAYHPAERPVTLWDGFDGSFYPPIENVPRQFAIVKANQYMVSNADFLICYVKHIGNTRNLLAYANKKTEKILNIAEIL